MILSHQKKKMLKDILKSVEKLKILKRFKNKGKWPRMLKENQTLSGKLWGEQANKQKQKNNNQLIKKVSKNLDFKKKVSNSPKQSLLSRSLSMLETNQNSQN
jgi:hypothetical protein